MYTTQQANKECVLYIQLHTYINLKLKAMWYNKIVMDNDNILSKEKYYVDDVWKIEEECGIDVMGNFVCEFWSEE